MRRSGVRFPSAPPPPGRSTLRVSGLRPACRSAATLVLADDGALVPASGMSGSSTIPPTAAVFGIARRIGFRTYAILTAGSWMLLHGIILAVRCKVAGDPGRIGAAQGRSRMLLRRRANARGTTAGQRSALVGSAQADQSNKNVILPVKPEGAPDSCVDGGGGRVSASWRALALPARSPVSFGRSGHTGLHFRQRSRRLAGADPTPPIPMNEKFLEV